MGNDQVDMAKATAIEFAVKDEPWVKYKLEDGTLLFGRLIIPKIFRSDDYDFSGNPIYAWSSQNLFTTICPRALRHPYDSCSDNPRPENCEHDCCGL